VVEFLVVIRFVSCCNQLNDPAFKAQRGLKWDLRRNQIRSHSTFRTVNCWHICSTKPRTFALAVHDCWSLEA